MSVTGHTDRHLPGVELFSKVFDLLGENVVVVDRTNTIQTPVKTKIYSPMPVFEKFIKSYEQICNERALDLLEKADNKNLPIYVFYSGGVDSSLVLISLLKNANERQKKNLRILMNQDSIGENPKLYADHLMGKLRLEASVKYPFLLSKNAIFIGGEYNDQLFGSDLFRDFMVINGEKAIAKTYDREMMRSLFALRCPDKNVVDWYLSLFEKLYQKCPCPSGTNADFFWWLNFSFKWQSVFFRMLTYASDRCASNIDQDFIDNYFFHFYGTKDFQLWSMNNPEKKIVDTWESYKLEAKKVIFDFTKDEWYYQNKLKQGSLYSIIVHQIQKGFIDEDVKMYPSLDSAEWHNPQNDFLVSP